MAMTYVTSQEVYMSSTWFYCDTLCSTMVCCLLSNQAMYQSACVAV
ncbi:hypothetical protein AVEN_66332-1, partial [Araneus ventricosus]